MLSDSELDPSIILARDSVSIPLQLGNEINAYALDSKNHKLECHYFPVFSDGVVVSIIIKGDPTDEGYPILQHGKTFADKLQAFIERNGTVAIVRTEHTLCAASDKEVIMLEWDWRMEDVPRPEDIPDFVKFTALSEGPYKRFEVPDCGYATFDGEPFVLEAPSRVLPTSYNVNVPVVTQTMPICWAASTACIANYLKGTSYTALSFFNTTIAQGLFFPIYDNEGKIANGMDMFQVMSTMGEMFGIMSTVHRATFDSITVRQILEAISGGKPVYTAMGVNTGGGHAIVSCGYDSLSGNSCNISFMDPNQTSIQRIPVSNIDNYSTYCYQHMLDGKVYSYGLNGYLLIQ